MADEDARHGQDGGSAPLGQYWPRDGGSAPLNAFVQSGASSSSPDFTMLPMAEPLDDKEEGRIAIRTGVRYPERAWDPVLRAQLILGDFAATRWQQIRVPVPSLDPEDLMPQISILIAPRPSRAERMGEIVEQA